MNKTTQQTRRMALITNHGYAGGAIPVGGAPDTGGQNFYVNSLAEALEACGYQVTIFTRGGFPFFQSTRIRQGIEKISPRVRYVYVPGGGVEFISKEDIAIALDEEVRWIYDFIKQESTREGVKPWQYYQMINTHYWDGALMGIKLVERWQNDLAIEFLSQAVSGGLKPYLKPFDGEEVHRLGLAREHALHLGNIIQKALKDKQFPKDLIPQSHPSLPGNQGRESPSETLKRTISLGVSGAKFLKVDDSNLEVALTRINLHVWTPHSVGIIKERNLWYKNPAELKKLKFRERESHECLISDRVEFFCSTSAEIYRALVSYHKVSPDKIFDFPPCIDQKIFRPRAKGSLKKAYHYLSKISGIAMADLQKAKIIFETSRMDQTKRKDILLKAFAGMTATTRDVFLFIGGGPVDSPLFKELSSLIENIDSLRGKAFMLGFVPGEILGELFSVADLFVSTSEMEGFGMSVSQAAASAVAVIATDLVPFATHHASDAAVIVPAGDIKGFTREMKRLLDNDQERKTRSEQLYQISRKLNWTDTTRHFISWIQEAREHMI